MIAALRLGVHSDLWGSGELSKQADVEGNTFLSYFVLWWSCPSCLFWHSDPSGVQYGVSLSLWFCLHFWRLNAVTALSHLGQQCCLSRYRIPAYVRRFDCFLRVFQRQLSDPFRHIQLLERILATIPTVLGETRARHPTSRRRIIRQTFGRI